MNTVTWGRGLALALSLATAAAAPAVHAQEASPPAMGAPFDGWELTISPYTYHFSNEDHTWVFLAGLERQYASNWLWGGALFRNSFGQPSGTAYVGYQWNRVFDVPQLYVKLVGGIMYGYVDEYEDKVPFNHNGWSPIILPGVGWRFTAKDAAQIILLGGNAVMFSYNRRF